MTICRAFFFDIRKDSPLLRRAERSDRKRRAYRTVLDTLFHALVRWLAPVLVFTSRGSVGDALSRTAARCICSNGRRFDAGWRDDDAGREVGRHPRELAHAGHRAIEPLRRDKVIGSASRRSVAVPSGTGATAELAVAELFIVSTVVHSGRWNRRDARPTITNAAAAGATCPKWRRTAILRPLRRGGEWLRNAVLQRPCVLASRESTPDQPPWRRVDCSARGRGCD